MITAGILKDRWLKTVPELEAKPQARLAGLSADSIHVLDRGIGHLIPTLDPQIVIAATQAVLWAAASGHAPEQGARQGALAASCAIATAALLLGVLTSVTIALFPHHVPLQSPPPPAGVGAKPAIQTAW